MKTTRKTERSAKRKVSIPLKKLTASVRIMVAITIEMVSFLFNMF